MTAKTHATPLVSISIERGNYKIIYNSINSQQVLTVCFRNKVYGSNRWITGTEVPFVGHPS